MANLVLTVQRLNTIAIAHYGCSSATLSNILGKMAVEKCSDDETVIKPISPMIRNRLIGVWITNVGNSVPMSEPCFLQVTNDEGAALLEILNMGFPEPIFNFEGGEFPEEGTIMLPVQPDALTFPMWLSALAHDLFTTNNHSTTLITRH